jgi:hypothetical protein
MTTPASGPLVRLASFWHDICKPKNTLTDKTEVMRVVAQCSMGTLGFLKELNGYMPALPIPTSLIGKLIPQLQSLNSALVVFHKTFLTQGKIAMILSGRAQDPHGHETLLKKAVHVSQFGRYQLEGFLIIKKWLGQESNKAVSSVKDTFAFLASGCGAVSAYKEIRLEQQNIKVQEKRLLNLQGLRKTITEIRFPSQKADQDDIIIARKSKFGLIDSLRTEFIEGKRGRHNQTQKIEVKLNELNRSLSHEEADVEPNLRQVSVFQTNTNKLNRLLTWYSKVDVRADDDTIRFLQIKGNQLNSALDRKDEKLLTNIDLLAQHKINKIEDRIRFSEVHIKKCLLGIGYDIPKALATGISLLDSLGISKRYLSQYSKQLAFVSFALGGTMALFGWAKVIGDTFYLKYPEKRTAPVLVRR